MRPYKSHWPNLFWEYRFDEHRRSGRKKVFIDGLPGVEELKPVGRPRDKQVFFSYNGDNNTLRYVTTSVLVDHEASPDEEEVGGYVPNGCGLIDNNAVAACAYAFKVLFHCRIGARLNALPGLESMTAPKASDLLRENGVMDPWSHVEAMVDREREAGFIVSVEEELILRARSRNADLRRSKAMVGGISGTVLKPQPGEAATQEHIEAAERRVMDRLGVMEEQMVAVKVELHKQERRLDDIQATLGNLILKINYIGKRLFSEYPE